VLTVLVELELEFERSRRVYLPAYLVELLRSWKAASESEMLFPNNKGNVPSDTHPTFSG
jgi:integrase